VVYVRCKIYFYLEDDSIQVIEPKVQNSGIPQGMSKTSLKERSNVTRVPGGVLSENLVGGVRRTPSNPYPISDQDM